MIKLIIGKKGAGKTKRLVEMVNSAAETSLGNVVCIEKGGTLTFSVSHKARLVYADDFSICGYDEYYGLLAGIKAGNADVAQVFGDATLRIGSRDYGELAAFLKRLAKIEDVEFVFTISCDEAELPAEIFEVAEKI